jgi:hypothetical protein
MRFGLYDLHGGAWCAYEKLVITLGGMVLEVLLHGICLSGVSIVEWAFSSQQQVNL